MNLKTARKAAATAARAAGRVMYANWHKPKHVNVDDPHDIKLELDVRCQKLIERSLRQAFPTVPLLGEEGIFGDVTADYRWVVDPIDGTVNYAFGLPHAAVSIAQAVVVLGAAVDGKVSGSRDVSFTVRPSDGTTQALVAAMSTATAQLADAAAGLLVRR